jgi:hypothetical protein
MMDGFRLVMLISAALAVASALAAALLIEGRPAPDAMEEVPAA